jgi:hypothetical protein
MSYILDRLIKPEIKLHAGYYDFLYETQDN